MKFDVKGGAKKIVKPIWTHDIKKYDTIKFTDLAKYAKFVDWKDWRRWMREAIQIHECEEDYKEIELENYRIRKAIGVRE